MTVTDTTSDHAEPSVGHDDTADAGDGDDALVEEDLLVEEISIDGMCGVY